MSRQARVVVEGVPHHITQRGNNRQETFLLDEDRRFYIEALRAKSKQHGVAILGYCLMTNHVHLVAVPRRPTSLARAIGQTHWRYTMRFNKRYGRSGHLWQNRFYSCPLGTTHLVAALAYVDLNPVRAGLVGKAAQHPWSSAGAHATGVDAAGLLDEWEWGELGWTQDWEVRLRVEAAGVRDAELRRNVSRLTIRRRPLCRGDGGALRTNVASTAARTEAESALSGRRGGMMPIACQEAVKEYRKVLCNRVK